MEVGTIPELADYLVNGYWNWRGTTAHRWQNASVSVNIDDLSTAEKALAISALNAWHEVAGVTFTFTSGPANITYLNNGSLNASTSLGWSGPYLTGATITISSNWWPDTDIYGYMYQTYLHETGHALGLGHQGPYNGSATYGVHNVFTNDTWQWSVMSYFAQGNYGGTSNYVISPQMADIYAMQTIYGAAVTRAGDSTYGFNSNAGPIFDFSLYSGTPSCTIYDSGGTDGLDCSGYTQAQTINLGPGQWSSIGGYINNIGIYLTTTIENAIGGGGNDTIIGNQAANELRGNGGHDSIQGGAGDDILNGGAGGDSLDGGGDLDTATYASATSGVTVNLAFPVANGGEASGDTYASIERVVGSQLGDILIGDDGSNFLSGLGGDDIFLGRGGTDSFDGGVGYDTVSYSISPVGIVVNLLFPLGNGGDAAGETYVSIEQVLGSQHADTLVGDSGNNVFAGLGGDDVFLGRGGADAFNGGNGSDAVSYTTAPAGVGVDLLLPGNNTGDALGDTFLLVENIFGSHHGDVLAGDYGANRIYGLGGNDTISGRGSADVLFGGAGSDTFIVAPGTQSDTIADFTAGLDLLRLIGFADITTLSALQAAGADAGPDSTYALGGGDTLILLGHNLADLQPADFLFA
jgi:serralysin